MDNIQWTDVAKESYLNALDLIFKRWSLDQALDWDQKVTNILKKLSTFKNLCPPSKKFPGLRRCTITEYTSLIYRINGDKIELITFFDNRADHPF